MTLTASTGNDAEPVYGGLPVPEVISLDGPWVSYRMAARAATCPKVSTRVNVTTGDVFDTRWPCGSWTHRRCAEIKARVHLDNITAYFAELGRADPAPIWAAVYPLDPGLVNRLKGRRHRAHRELGREVHSVTVARPDGLHVFATEDLGARGDPLGSWYPVPVALVLVRVALRLPGVRDHKPINYQGDWTEPPDPFAKPPPKGDSKMLLAYQAGSRTVAELACDSLGVELVPSVRGGFSRPASVAEEDWLAAVNAATYQVRREGSG